MTVLVTGYEPFGDHDRNPSAAVAGALDGRTVRGETVVGRVLPVVFDRARGELADLLADHDPEVVLGTGLAAGAAGVRVERVGVNVRDAAGTPDNDDSDPRNEPVDPDGPDAYLATVPVVESVEALLDAGVPARVSNTAGTHLCNDFLYGAHRLLDRRDHDAAAGFLHLPQRPADAARAARDGTAARGGSVQPSLPQSTQERAARTVLDVALAARPG